MTAKEKQQEFIRSFLKPTLKLRGYQSSRMTWWKDRGDFFYVINLQNYSWNSKDNVDFRFNIGIALKAILKDTQKKKVTQFDLAIHLDEGAFLPDRKNRRFGNNQGYSISEGTDLNEFIQEIKSDLEIYVLPILERPQNLYECVKFYESYPFWGDNLNRLIKENNIKTH